MPKVKIARKSISLDMTAMCDMAFLLLTFFMLTTKFKPDEPVSVDMPKSISETKLPDIDVMMITVDKEGKVFFGIDAQPKREEMLNSILGKYKIGLTEAQIKEFSLLTTFGCPVSFLPQYLKMEDGERRSYMDKHPELKGIPFDSTNNELRDWVAYARYANTKLRIAVKADAETPLKAVSQVVDILQDQNINKLNFVTNLREKPKVKLD